MQYYRLFLIFAESYSNRMTENIIKTLTFAEFSRKFGISKSKLSKSKDKFQVDPGFDVEKLLDNEFNASMVIFILETTQSRPGAKGQKKSRKKID